jgi:2-polyprenyl-3-methyl-5-hydroxy-6-metoxy-1,4-benzoquinol methylase
MLGQYDLIICMHLLEHLSEPVEYLKKIKPLLTPDGKVLFEVPNIDCFLGEISPEYNDFMYLYEHCSYYNANTIRLVFEKAGYKVTKVYTKEIYSVENHCRWIREGKPFIKYNQMYMPDSRLEWINEAYKEKIGKDGKGYSLIIEAGI